MTHGCVEFFAQCLLRKDKNKLLLARICLTSVKIRSRDIGKQKCNRISFRAEVANLRNMIKVSDIYRLIMEELVLK